VWRDELQRAIEASAKRLTVSGAYSRNSKVEDELQHHVAASNNQFVVLQHHEYIITMRPTTAALAQYGTQFEVSLLYRLHRA